MLIIKPHASKEVVIRVPASTEEQVIRIRAIDRNRGTFGGEGKVERCMGFACGRAIVIRHEPFRPIDRPAGVSPSGSSAPDARSDPMALKDPKPTPKRPTDDERQEPDAGIDTDNRDG